MNSTTRECAGCSKQFQTKHKLKRYCTRRCNQEACRIRYGTQKQFHGVASSTVGAIRELDVASDLLKKGSEVFRSLSPACSADLVICKNGFTFRVEVKSCFLTTTNKMIPYTRKMRADILALVTPQSIYYEPEPEELCSRVKHKHKR